jgi:lysophospholipase L1-like esterase
MSRVKLVLVQVAIFATLLVAADALLWLFVRVPHEGVQTQHVRNHALPGLKEQIVYRTIGHRLRSASIQTARKPAGSIRVLCLGASTTDQLTQATEDTWCAVLEREVRASMADVSAQWHAVSYGRSGDRMIDTARWMRSMVDVLEPDVVVTLLGVNDLAWSGGPGFAIRAVDDAMKDGERPVGTRVFLERCADFSQICRLVSRAWNGVAIRLDLRGGRVVNWEAGNLPSLNREWRALPGVEGLKRDPDPLDEFRAALGWMLDFLKSRDIHTIVLGQPVLWRADLPPEGLDRLWFSVATASCRVRPSLGWLEKEMRRYNSAQQQEAQARGVGFVDLEGRIPKTLDHFFDDCHFTDKGSMLVGRLVAPALEAVLERAIARRGSSGK